MISAALFLCRKAANKALTASLKGIFCLFTQRRLTRCNRGLVCIAPLSFQLSFSLDNHADIGRLPNDCRGDTLSDSLAVVQS